jgi:hypothetical protein
MNTALHPKTTTNVKSAFAIIILHLVLISACGKKQDSNSYLTNSGDFRERSEAADTAEATTSRFVLWLTDTTAMKEKPAALASSMNAEDLDYVKKYFHTAGRPKRGDFIASSGGMSVIAFSGADTMRYPGGHFWLKVKTSAGTVTDAEVFTEPETFDSIEMIMSASKRVQEIHASLSGKDRKAGNETLYQLSPGLYPDLNAVKTALRELFTVNAAVAVIAKLGIKAEGGAVWTSTRSSRESRSWEDARITAISRDAKGFILTLAVPTADFQNTSTTAVPFVMTMEGWRIDGVY